MTSKRSFETKTDNDDDEKEYDKVLRHIRLSNDPRERPNNENYYAHRMNELAQQGKVRHSRSVNHYFYPSI